MNRDIDLDKSRMLLERRIKNYSGSNLYYSSGAVVKPTWSYNPATRDLTVGAGTYRAFLTTDFTGELYEYSVGETVLNLADDSKYYVSTKYNNGNPIVYAEENIITANDSDVIAIYTIFTEGTELDVLDWGTEGVSLANKINERIIDTNRYGIAYGFDLSASSLIITISGGRFFLGTNRIDFGEINSTTNECELLYKNPLGGWLEQDILTYPNTKYDDGSGTLADLTDTHYGVIWVWKSAGNPIEMYSILGDQSYATLDLAKTSKVPSDTPEKVTLGSFLVGRIIYQKGSTSAVVESSFSTIFGASAPTNHEGLLNLLGGGAGEHFHITSAEYTVVQNTTNTNSGDETNATILTKIGYTPEDVSNKATTLSTSNDTLYPTTKAVKDALDIFSLSLNPKYLNLVATPSLAVGTITGASPNSITDSTKSWTVNQWVDKVVKIYNGEYDYGLVLSNTATTITFDANLTVTPTTGHNYKILDAYILLHEDMDIMVSGVATTNDVAIILPLVNENINRRTVNLYQEMGDNQFVNICRGTDRQYGYKYGVLLSRTESVTLKAHDYTTNHYDIFSTSGIKRFVTAYLDTNEDVGGLNVFTPVGNTANVTVDGIRRFTQVDRSGKVWYKYNSLFDRKVAVTGNFILIKSGGGTSTLDIIVLVYDPSTGLTTEINVRASSTIMASNAKFAIPFSTIVDLKYNQELTIAFRKSGDTFTLQSGSSIEIREI